MPVGRSLSRCLEFPSLSLEIQRCADVGGRQIRVFPNDCCIRIAGFMEVPDGGRHDSCPGDGGSVTNNQSALADLPVVGATPNAQPRYLALDMLRNSLKHDGKGQDTLTEGPSAEERVRLLPRHLEDNFMPTNMNRQTRPGRLVEAM